MKTSITCARLLLYAIGVSRSSKDLKTRARLRPQLNLSRAIFCLTLTGLGMTTVSLAQMPIPDDFNVSLSIADTRVLIPQTDGGVLAAGVFYPGATLGSGVIHFDAAGILDPAFKLTVGSPAESLTVQPDGKIIVGGNFITLGRQAYRGLGRLNADGTVDTSFNPGSASLEASCLALQPDGKVLVGGTIFSLGAEGLLSVARVNTDGSVDTNFHSAQGMSVRSIALQADGRILVGGFFLWMGEQLRNNIARLNSDGTVDSTFDPGADQSVLCLALQPDGKILVGGSFTTLAGESRNHLGRLNLDGTLDTDFNPSPNDQVATLCLQSDGKILVGGGFTQIGGLVRSNIARLNYDGTVDMEFDSGTDGAVCSLAIQSDGKILVGGSFTNLGGESRTNLGRLKATDPATSTLSVNSTEITWLRGGTSPEVMRTTFEVSTNHGAQWTLLGAGTRISGGWSLMGGSVGPNDNVRARGYVAAGRYNGSSYIVEDIIGPPVLVSQPINRTNSADTAATFKVMAGGSGPLTLQWVKEGTILTDSEKVAGSDTSTLTLSHVFAADQGEYSVIVSNAFGSVTNLAATLTVRDPTVTGFTSTGWINAGDNADFFVTAKGTGPISYYWEKDGVLLGNTNAAWTLTNAQPADTGLYVVTVSNVYGTFRKSLGNLYVNKFVPDQTNRNVDGPVRAVVLQTDGGILLGGSFTNVAGQTRKGIARFHADGTLDTAFNPGVEGSVNCLALQENGKILVGGWFTQLAGQTRMALGQLNSDGTLDDSFNSGASGPVCCFASQPDGRIVVGGAFTNLAGQLRSRIGRLNSDGSLDQSFNPAGANSDVFCLALQRDGKILVGGAFTNLATQSRKGLGRLNSDGSLDTNFNTAAEVYAGYTPDGMIFAPGQVYALAIKGNGEIMVAGNFYNLGGSRRSGIGLLNSDGALDDSFSVDSSLSTLGLYSFVTCLAMQTDNTTLVGGSFTQLGSVPVSPVGRLLSDGSTDANFNPAPDTNVNAMVIQEDGKLLIGGDFTIVNGIARQGLVRLTSSETATQSFSLSGGKLLWLREGTSVEFWRANFAASTNNGISWFTLGEAERVPQGWQLPNVAIPNGSMIRARGFVTGGYNNGSTWYVESILSNRVPVADASATQPAVYSPDAQPAAILLDGSRSSDPDHDTLHYAWYLAGDSTPLCEGQVAQTSLPGGCHALLLEVNDGMWKSCSAFTVEVLTPALPIGRIRPSPAPDRMQLEFCAEPGRTYSIEVSTNLIHWEPIGEAVQKGDLSFRFEDSILSQGGARFYRVRAP